MSPFLKFSFELYFFLVWVTCSAVFQVFPNVEGAESCNVGHFRCIQSNLCIPLGWLCDGEIDCASSKINDTSDEDHSRCRKEHVCLKNFFRCNDGITCRKISKLCDGNNDCPDFSDEGSFCKNKSICVGTSCTYGCKPSPKGPLCFCGEGKEPHGNDCMSIQDSKCENDALCDQICSRKDSEYECSCVEGYKAKGRKCIGINVPAKAPMSIIFTNSANLQHIFLNGSLLRSSSIVKVAEKSAVDFDHRNETVCWAVKSRFGSELECCNAYNFSNCWKFKLPDLYSQSTISQISYEWVSGNWYILDEVREMLIVCNHTLSVCTSLLDISLSKPKDIALDPSKGLMFYTIWGQAVSSALERANLDGSERIKLVIEKVVGPTGITVDIPTQSVYWIDTYLGTIERIGYTGSGRKTIVRNTQVKSLHGISVFEDYLYVTSVEGNNILAIQKNNQTSPTSIKSNMTQPYHIRVYHRQRQPNVMHPCSVKNGLCDHICVPLFKEGVAVVKCLCKTGYNLVARGKKCVAAKQGQFLLYGRGHPGAIKGISLNMAGKQEEVLIPILDLNRPIAMDYDARSQFIYYSDAQRFVIERQKIDGSQRDVYLEKGKLHTCNRR